MAITTSDIRALREIEQILGKKEAGYYKDQTDPNYLYITTKIIKLINPLFPYKNYTPGMDLGFWMPVDPRTLIIGSNIYKSAVSTYQAMV